MKLVKAYNKKRGKFYCEICKKVSVGVLRRPPICCPEPQVLLTDEGEVDVSQNDPEVQKILDQIDIEGKALAAEVDKVITSGIYSDNLEPGWTKEEEKKSQSIDIVKRKPGRPKKQS